MVRGEGESELEETYYYRLRDPENGWAVQRVYSPERDFDLASTVTDGELLLIPWGYHTTVAAHGHDLYYLNMLGRPGAEADPAGLPGPVPQGHAGRLAGRRHGRAPADHPPPSWRLSRSRSLSPLPITEGDPIVPNLQPHPAARPRPGRREVPRRPAASSATATSSPFFGGAIGIFGHGNVAGVGQALLQYRKDFRLYQARNEQGMVHMATGYAKRQEPARRTGLQHLDRPGRDEHDHRCGDGHGEPPARALPAERHLRQPADRCGAAAAGVPLLLGQLGERRLQGRLAVLGPDQPSRAAADRAAGGDAHPDQPGRHRRGDDLAAAGRPGRGVGLPDGAVP